MENVLLVLVGIIIVLMVTACPQPIGSELSTEKEIAAFSFTAAANGALSQREASNILPIRQTSVQLILSV